MPLSDHADHLGPELFRAIERKGYAELTAVQRAVLDPALAGRDLRITSQTGSGKTLAIGLSLRALALGEAPATKGVAHPRALVVAPTRELAHQVEQELTWLYAESGIRLATTTGGASYRDEHRALSKGPAVIVGTPGRLLDHLQRGSIDASQVTTVVLDEADRMLDLGFREDLEQLFERVPEPRTTHLVSATFPHVVRSFADRLQREPAHVQGTRLGAANADIDHVIHVVASEQRLDALINLLLANPEDQTLVFVRTRADAAHIANELVVTGFAASALSGEMEQAARNRALEAFRAGRLRVLVATDVAARGIDVQGVTRVVHGELPTNPDAYTHRSGRTGRAGRKGTSSLLVAPIGVVRAARLLRGLGITHRMEPIPTAAEILQADDARLFAELTAPPVRAESARDVAGDADSEVSTVDDAELPEREAEELAAKRAAKKAARELRERAAEEEQLQQRWEPLATRLLEAGDTERTLARLLAMARRSVTAPRDVRVFPMRAAEERPRGRGGREARETFDPRARRRERAPSREDARQYERPRSAGHEGAREPSRDSMRERTRAQPSRERSNAASAFDDAAASRAEPRTRDNAGAFDDSADHTFADPRGRHARQPREPRQAPAAAESGYTSFHVSWGERGGADARRLLAMLCRRGQIRGRDVGAIRVESNFSLVQVSNDVVPDFARAASRPDPREPEIVIRLDRAQSAADLADKREKLRVVPKRADKGGSRARPHAGPRRDAGPRREGGHRPPKRHKARGR